MEPQVTEQLAMECCKSFHKSEKPGSLKAEKIWTQKQIASLLRCNGREVAAYLRRGGASKLDDTAALRVWLTNFVCISG
jgi:hypothetical protein